MAKEKVEPTALEGKMDLALPDGSLLRIQPGPYGKGISVTPLGKPGGRGAGHRGKGRPPRPSTLELRERLLADQAAGKLRAARDYVDWVAERDPQASRASLQQTVYRELRAVGGSTTRGRRRGAAAARRAGKRGAGAEGRRGRAPNPATVALRERLAKDKEAGTLREAAHYLRWMVERSDLGLKKARPIVYRELRAIG